MVGILRLPSTRTLKDYKNFIKPGTGFRQEIVQDLVKMTKEYSNTQRYLVLMFDEMKIKSNLVIDKHSDELIGFVDLGDPDLNFASFHDEINTLATHALIFYLRGISTNLKYCFSHFATKGINAPQIMQIFWEAVYVLEELCNLWVIAACADGASANRSFFKLHQMLNSDSNKTVCYNTQNLFAPWRNIYFFADAPHLLKTARNCLHHSSFGGGRCMWNSGKYLLWHHIVQMYNQDMENGLKLLPRVTDQHINLNPYSVMTVKFAVQVLSKSMSTALNLYGSTETSETSKYCENLNNFFDCLNVRSLDEAKKLLRNEFLKPYRDPNDERFKWLKEHFLQYFEDWKKSIKEREGEFTNKDKGNMFVSQQTYEGLQITTYSLIETVKYLLNKGVPYVLSERFCQDPAEEYFGAQRQHGRRNENPDYFQFGYKARTLGIQREVS